MVCWISATDAPEAFPPAGQALEEPNGLLAAGGDLSPARLLCAYRQGIFPWYEQGEPILWWSPDPRTVLWPEALRVSRSLRKTLARGRFEVTADRAFGAVIEGCAEPRAYGGGTWITQEMVDAYNRLHRLGWAHSFEAWRDGALVGGVYGVAIGRVFFGESMFTRATDASKVAFVKAVEYMRRRGCALIDCQVRSSHIESLGAGGLRRREFLEHLAVLCDPAGQPGSWTRDFEHALQS